MTFTFGHMHVDRIDQTGYTRVTLLEEHAYGRYVAAYEWVAFDEPLPHATKYRAPLPMPFRLYNRNA